MEQESAGKKPVYVYFMFMYIFYTLSMVEYFILNAYIFTNYDH